MPHTLLDRFRNILLRLFVGFAPVLGLAQSQTPAEPDFDERYFRENIRQSSLGGGFSTRYMAIKDSGFAPALQNNNIALKTSGIIWGGFGYVESGDGWRIGGGGWGHENSFDRGSDFAQIGIGWGAFYLAKDLLPNMTLDVVLGGAIGGGEAHLTLFSESGDDGRVLQDFFVVEPHVAIEFLLTDALKLGLLATWFYPVGENNRFWGDDLSIGKIANSTWTMGLQITFGWFGRHSWRTRKVQAAL